MKQYLLLVDDEQYYPELNNVDICSIYYRIPKILRIIRLFHHKYPVLKCLRHIWLGNWKNNVRHYDKIVIYDSIYDDSILDYLKKNTSAKIALCYRNRVLQRTTHKFLTKNTQELRDKFGCELWSYSQDDCHSFNMNYYSQFLLQQKLQTDYYIQDVFFVGRDKGRLHKIMQIGEMLAKHSVSYKFCIVPDDENQYTIKERAYMTSSMTYQEVLENIKCSKCILDVVSEDNYGLTYRPLEALFYGKKLLTNYTDIKCADFYDKENIFVIGDDDEKALSSFVNSSFKELSADTKNKYSFQSFLNLIFRED